MVHLSPSYWGPPFWTILYTTAYTFDPAMADSVETFYRVVSDIIPCPECQAHYREYLETHEIKDAVKSRELLLNWVSGLHNEVNRKTGATRVDLDEKIDEMDKYNDDIIKIPERTPTGFGVRRPPGTPARFDKKYCGNCRKPKKI